MNWGQQRNRNWGQQRPRNMERGAGVGLADYLLLQPNISVSSSMDGVSEAQQQGFQVFRDSTFTISCSIQPQYPGGSFQLTFTSSNSAHNSTQPAVNHSAHFLFPAAEPAHQGTYSCVYRLYVFSHNFSSESRLLSLTVSDLLLQPNISVSSSMDGGLRGPAAGVPGVQGLHLHYQLLHPATSPPTKEHTAVFIISMFSLITSPLRAVCSLSPSQTCCFSPTSLCPPPWTGSPRPSSRGSRCSGTPPSLSAAPSSHSTQEAPSSSPSPPPTQHTTTPSQLSITLPTSCFLLQSPPTKEHTAVFIISMFSLITSPLRAVCSLSPSQTCCFSPTSLCPPPWTGSPRPSSRGSRCSGTPPSLSAAPSSHSTQEASSSSHSPPPTQHTTTPSQLSITLPTSCFLLQSLPTKEHTAVFIISMFSLITSPLRAVCSLSPSQIHHQIHQIHHQIHQIHHQIHQIHHQIHQIHQFHHHLHLLEGLLLSEWVSFL
ncbi:uncharacterized protein LOC144535541 [Sander vitreus]